MMHSGSCACGAVTVEATGDHTTVSISHSTQFQKRTGSRYSVHAYFQRPAVAIRGETRSHRCTGDTGCYITFQFRPVCASTLH